MILNAHFAFLLQQERSADTSTVKCQWGGSKSTVNGSVKKSCGSISMLTGSKKRKDKISKPKGDVGQKIKLWSYLQRR